MRVTKGSEQYFGECLEYPVKTHGKTLEELAENMEKALNLFIDEIRKKSENEEMIVGMKVELPQVDDIKNK